MKGVNIFLADGFEDMEALATNDILRRGGVEVNLIAIKDEPYVASSHGVTVCVEQFLSDVEENHKGTNAKDFMIFPGGMPGSSNLAGCPKLIRLMKEHVAKGGSVAAICAAPGLVLSQLDNIKGLDFTCFDGFEAAAKAKGVNFVKKPSVSQRLPEGGLFITGRSAGYAPDFALEILSAIAPAENLAKAKGGVWIEVE